LKLRTIDQPGRESQILSVSSFRELVDTPFHGKINAMCWKRKLSGNFAEIVDKVQSTGNITTIDEEELRSVELTGEGAQAREMLLNDWKMLEEYGASPTINLISYYDRDESSFFPTDVYSFHADRSPIPTATFLCTYHGEPSEILPNREAIQKILVPDIRNRLREQYRGAEQDFESYLAEHFYDLHYQALPHASPVSLGHGHLWKLAVDHPQSEVLPCIHRAPKEKNGQKRLLLIC
jgi:hypothetical protein